MIFTEEHDMVRETIRDFVEAEINPNVDEWESAGEFPAHELFSKLGDLGLIGIEYDPTYGGQGADHTFTVVLGEELGRADCAGIPLAISVQTDMATPALHEFGSEELKQKYLAPAIRGEMVTSIAVTEADAGSDVSAIRTRAVRDGDELIVNGSKTFITNAVQADWLCLLARTSDEGGYTGMSQIVFPTDTPGFSVAKKFDKLGNRASDTAEIVFEDCRIPAANIIGVEGMGFQQQMTQFQNERMIATYMCVGGMQRALDRTTEYLKERKVFGKPLINKQYVQFRLAELTAEVDLLRHYNYACADAYVRGENTMRFSTIAKLKAGRLQRAVSDACMQFHGGIGYMEETWTSRYFRDARLTSIGGGADEVMLYIIAKMDGLEA